MSLLNHIKIPGRKRIVLVAAGIIFVTALFFFFYKFGFLKYLDLVRQKNALIENINEMDKKNDLLKAEIDSLKTRDAKIEKVAREKYHMVRKGEKVFVIEEK
ncbi:MAG: FtsB family cell division protein [Ignavibacteriales bacterium]